MSSSSESKASKAGMFSRIFSRKAASATVAEAPAAAVEASAAPKSTGRRIGRVVLIALPIVIAGAGGAGAYLYVAQPFPGLLGVTKVEVVTPAPEEKAVPSTITIASATPTEDLRPSDYQIVMVFGEEAYLSSPHALVRVKVGQTLPGLGEVLSIKPADGGGIVEAANATLKTVAE